MTARQQHKPYRDVMHSLHETIQHWQDKFRQAGHMLFDTFLKPRAIRDEDWRKEFILNTLLLCILAMLTVFGAIVVRNTLRFGSADDGVTIGVFGGVYVAVVVLYCLSRAGFRLLAAYLLILILCTGNALSNAHWGIDIPGVLLSYGLAIVLAGILIDSRAALLTTIAVAAVLNVVGYLQLHGHIHAVRHWRHALFTQRDAIEFSIYLAIIMAVSWLSNREINISMRKALRSERMLLAERENLERIVEQRTMQLRQAQLERIDQLYRFAEFGKLSSGFFHDLSNPLTALQLYLNDIRSASPALVSELQSDIQKAQEAADHIEKFTESMKRQLREQNHNEQFSVADEVRNVLQLMNHRLLSFQVLVAVDIPSEIMLYGNPLRFHQVISNLLMNAIDAYANVEDNRTRQVMITGIETSQDTDKNLTLRVQDNASGIPENLLPMIFEPFFSTKSHVTNMGIGMASIKTIVEKEFLGTIAVRSTVDRGTEFLITVPLQPL